MIFKSKNKAPLVGDVNTFLNGFANFTSLLDNYSILALTHSYLNLNSAGIDLTSESDVSRRQILTSKVDPRTVRVKIFIMTVDP